VYFNVNFNVFFLNKKVHLLVSELYIYQYARCNNKKKTDTTFVKSLTVTSENIYKISPSVTKCRRYKSIYL